MNKRLVPVALALLSVPLVGGMAYAATQSVSTRPSPQVVIPAVASAGAPRDAREDRATVEDRATPAPGPTALPPTTTAARDAHDAGDDRGGATPTTRVTTTSVPGTDDGPNHDVNDDHGGRATVTVPAPPPRTTVPTTSIPDDRGRQAEPGDDRGAGSGPGPSGSGSGSGSGKGGGR